MSGMIKEPTYINCKVCSTKIVTFVSKGTIRELCYDCVKKQRILKNGKSKFDSKTNDKKQKKESNKKKEVSFCSSENKKIRPKRGKSRREVEEKKCNGTFRSLQLSIW